MEDHSKCIACTKPALVPFGKRKGYTYWQCTQCRTLQLHPIPDHDTLKQQYAQDYLNSGHLHNTPEARKTAAAPYYTALNTILAQHTFPGTAILEVGAGWGGLLELLTEDGYTCRGLEPIAEMAQYANRQGLPVEQGELTDATPIDPVDVMLLSAVFEHLPDPGTWLDLAHNHLKDHGKLISLQPTAPFATCMGTVLRLGIRNLPLPQLHEVFCPPWHIALYSPKGMQQLAERHGFSLKEIHPAPQGNSGGLTGLLQHLLQQVNNLGVRLMGTHWPFLICHIFVLEKEHK